MKTVEFVVIFSLGIHFACTSSINLDNNDATVENAVEKKDNTFVPIDEEALEGAIENAVETGDNTFVPSDEEALDTSGSGVEIWDARQCLPGSCNAHCRRLGHARGVCIGNFCQCRLRSSPLASFKQEIEPRNRLGCSMLSCLNICTRLGFRYFNCSNGRCTCWN